MFPEGIDIYYFTGTGNTLLIAEQIADSLRQGGVEVRLQAIEKSRPAGVKPGRTLGFGFPICALATYPFVWEFLKELPPGNGTKAFMFSTLGGAGGGIRGPLKRLLKKKGYQPIGAADFRMPPNIFIIFSDQRNQRRIQKGYTRAAAFAEKLLNGKARWRSVPILGLFTGAIARSLMRFFDWPPHQKLFRMKVDVGKCTGCGQRARLCPTHNIKIEEKLPLYSLKCQYCMRCISFCPAWAIHSSFMPRERANRSVPADKLL
jgi:flavodoxin/Pyruvate/2-oxoacid:ferredoxin oxidoreductase delta subunit